MKLGLFGCCGASNFLAQYDSSVGAVLDKLGIEFLRLRESNCCGYPMRNVNFKAFLLSSARNLALAEKRGADLVTSCNCCYGTVKYVKHLLESNREVKQEMNSLLNAEGLSCSGKSDIRHVLEVLYNNREALSAKMAIRVTGLKVALHYGCHILRPSKLVAAAQPDPLSMCDRLIDMTGAKRVAWKEMLQCCGAPMVGINDPLSMRLLEKKINSVAESAADCVCVICPFCQIQFAKTRKRLAAAGTGKDYPPSISYIQLLGLCLGIEEGILGLDRTQKEHISRRRTEGAA